MLTLLFKCWTIEDCHFAVAAVKAKCKSLAVVQQKERAVVFAAVMFWTHADFVADAVTASHELRILKMSKFKYETTIMQLKLIISLMLWFVFIF